MLKAEIRPGVVMAYEDHWFGKPWMVPEPVVMIHGNSESSRAWTCWVPHLSDRFRVVRPDLPGFGQSTEPAGYGWSAGEIAADIVRFLDAAGIARCHLVGAKYGGSACMLLAAEHPQRLFSLALFGSPFRGSGSGNADRIRTMGVRGWAADTQHSRLGSTASPEQIAWWTDELMGKTSTRAAFGAASARIDMNLDETLVRIAAPTLIVTTQESGLHSVAAVERAAALIARSQVVVLEGDSYHIAAAEPEICAGHFLRFMDEVVATKAPAGTSPAATREAVRT